jgi:hypothetical protein
VRPVKGPLRDERGKFTCSTGVSMHKIDKIPLTGQISSAAKSPPDSSGFSPVSAAALNLSIDQMALLSTKCTKFTPPPPPLIGLLGITIPGHFYFSLLTGFRSLPCLTQCVALAEPFFCLLRVTQVHVRIPWDSVPGITFKNIQEAFI